MKYQVSLNGKQFEVEVEKGSVSAVPTGAAPAPAPAAQPAATAQPAFTPAIGDSASLPFDDPTSAHPNIAVNDPAGDLDIPDFLR